MAKATLFMSEEFFTGLISGWEEFRTIRVIKNKLPDDIKIVSIEKSEVYPRTLALTLESESFAEGEILQPPVYEEKYK